MDTPDKSHELISFPSLRRVPAAAPLDWLRDGAADLRRAPHTSLCLGTLFAVMGYSLQQALTTAPHWALALITGFVLIGPFLAIGFYDISRRLERGQPINLGAALWAWWEIKGIVGLFSIILALLMAGWVRVSVVLVGLFFMGAMPTMETLLEQLFFANNLPFMLIYFGIGGLFAALVFALSVVSIPLMMDRDTDTVTAMIASIAAVIRNPGAMALWAALIMGLCLLGMLTSYLGLIVAMPLVGHATWHAYRALVE